MPSVTIKAIVKGCPVYLSFGRNNSTTPAIFHTGMRIYDDPTHFLSITGIQRFIDGHMSIEKIMNRGSTFIHFYNELAILTATAELTLNPDDRLKVLSLLSDTTDLYVGDFNDLAKYSLDCFEYSVGVERNEKKVQMIETLMLEWKLTNWTIMQNIVAGINENNVLIVNDLNEGSLFETEIWAALESTFDNQIFKNPLIPDKNGTRELIDVLAYSDYSVFLIETKAISIYNADINRSMEKKVAHLQKQIKKAIGQLVGASKKIMEKVTISDIDGREISFDKTLLPHCIVLVSELLYFGDWKAIEMQMFRAMIENQMYLNVMDLKEFIKIIKASRGDKDKLDYHLVKRVEGFVKHETILIDSRFITDDN